MAMNTIPEFLFKVFVTVGLVATLTCCGGDRGNSTSSSLSSSTARSLTSSSTASSLTSSSSVSSVPVSPYLIGGAIQSGPLNIAPVVSTLAGTARGADGIGAAASFTQPIAIVREGNNLYVVDDTDTIRKIVLSTGEVTTLAGTVGRYGNNDGAGTAARFKNPKGITSDGTNLYVADTENCTIRKIVISTGAVTTLAGMPSVQGSTDDTGTAARFYYPGAITTDGSNLYVADTYNSIIRKIVISTGAVTTIAGTADVFGNADGTGAAARFRYPAGIATDGYNLYVADSLNNTIRKIVISTGAVITLAGTAGVSGVADGTGAAARFDHPQSITTDGTNLYVTDTGNNTIRKIVISTGIVTTLAGTAGVYGSVDGTGEAASFFDPMGVTADGTNLYVTDTYNSTIRKIVISTGAVTTFAGTVYGSSSADGTGAAARFSYPSGIATDGYNLYVADALNNTIRKIVISTGAVITLAGTAGVSGVADGTGAAARFNNPQSITTDGTNLYVADASSFTIRKIVISTGAVTTLAGKAGYDGIADGIGEEARFYYPTAITTDGINLYVADTHNSTIRKIVISTGAVTTLAGTAGVRGSADDTGTAARFYYPQGITTDGTNLYVADTYNNIIRKIVISTGAVTTLAGTAGGSGSVDGTGAIARFSYPRGITTDGTNLYVTDAENSTIRIIFISTGAVTTLAGTVGVSGSADGVGAAASFNSPSDITTDGFDLFVTDTTNNTIRKIH